MTKKELEKQLYAIVTEVAKEIADAGVELSPQDEDDARTVVGIWVRRNKARIVSEALGKLTVAAEPVAVPVVVE